MRVYEGVESCNLKLTQESLDQIIQLDMWNNIAAAGRQRVSIAYADAYNAIEAQFESNRSKLKKETKNKNESDMNEQKQMTSVCRAIVVERTKETIEKEKAIVEAIRNESAEFISLANSVADAFSMFLENSRKFIERQIDELVQNRIEYANIVSAYTQRISDAVAQLFDEVKDPEKTKKWTDEERREKFEKIFETQYSNAKRDNPPLNVREEITTIYGEELKSEFHNEIMKIVNESKQNESTKSKVNEKSYATRISERVSATIDYFSGKAETDRKVREADNNALDRLYRAIAAKLSNETRFRHEFVREIIDDTRAHFALDTRVRIKHEAHAQSYRQLCDRLKKLQLEWEEKNSVPQRLNDKKEDVYVVFDAKCEGKRGMKMLEIAMIRLLGKESKRMHEAYQMALATAVITELEIIEANDERKYKWTGATNGEELQSLIDLDLLKQLDTMGESEAKQSRFTSDLRNSGWHNRRVVREAITKVAEPIANDLRIWNNLHDRVYVAIREAAILADGIQGSKKVKANRAEAFLNSIQTNPNVPSAITGNLPSLSSIGDVPDTDNGTKEYAALVDVICAAMAPKDKKPFKVSIADSLVNSIWKQMSTSRGHEKFKRRCEECCKMCGLACTSAEGHGDDHTTHHQPMGLNGWHWEHTKELTKLSCVECYHGHVGFIYRGTRYEWNQWPSVFTGWQIPGQSSLRLKLREFIFYNYQSMLAKHFGYNPLPQHAMSEFNRDKEQLRRELARIAGVQNS